MEKKKEKNYGPRVAPTWARGCVTLKRCNGLNILSVCHPCTGLVQQTFDSRYKLAVLTRKHCTILKKPPTFCANKSNL